MEKVMPIKKQYHKHLPAITHVDGSGRLQTVTKQDNRIFYQIIQEFERLTTYPKFDNIRRFLSPLYENFDSSFSKILFNEGFL